MTSNRDRRRAAASARLERQMAIRAEAVRRRRRRTTIVASAAGATVVVVAAVWIVVANTGTTHKPVAKGSASASPTGCNWQPLVDPSATPTPQPLPSGIKDVGTPPKNPPRTGTQVMTITTNLGAIKVEMDLSKTPCTAASFAYLASKKFFDGSSCHRLVQEINALQCGDPSGTGSGGPNYRFGNENLPTGRRPTYPKGTVAMANAGSQNGDTNGSQFFFVYNDDTADQLPADYSLFGTVTAGLDILEKVAAAGDDGAFAQPDAQGNPGPGGGHPKTPLTFQSVTVSAPSPSQG